MRWRCATRPCWQCCSSRACPASATTRAKRSTSRTSPPAARCWRISSITSGQIRPRRAMTTDARATIRDFLARSRTAQTQFLAELVKVPSDNPPGDCAAHARRTKQLLEQLGLSVEAHDVPRASVEAVGMKSVTNLIVRHRFGDGPVIALNAHGDVVPPGLGWRVDPYGAVIEDGTHGPVMYGRGGV